MGIIRELPASFGHYEQFCFLSALEKHQYFCGEGKLFIMILPLKAEVVFLFFIFLLLLRLALYFSVNFTKMY